MATYVYRKGELVLKEFADPIERSALAPYVISDNMQPSKHHGSGRVIDSKARFRAETRAMGMVEMGNEKPKPRTPIRLDKRQRRDDIKRAVWQLRNNAR